MDAEVRGLNVAQDIDHLEWSISISRAVLSPFLYRLWAPAIV